jgi:hypothetical protein
MTNDAKQMTNTTKQILTKQIIIMRFYYFFIALILISINCKVNRNLSSVESNNVLNEWILQVNRKALEISKQRNECFTSMGINKGNTLRIAAQHSRLEAEFHLPESINMKLNTFAVINDDVDITLISYGEIWVRDLEYIIIDTLLYENEYYLSTMVLQNKEDFFNNPFLYINLEKSASDIEKIKEDILKRDKFEMKKKDIDESDNLDILNWERTMMEKAADEFGDQSLIYSFAVGVDENCGNATTKAKHYAMTSIPEKMEVYSTIVFNIETINGKVRSGFESNSIITKYLSELRFLEYGRKNFGNRCAIAIIVLKEIEPKYKKYFDYLNFSND